MSRNSDRLLLLLAYLGFISLGLPDAVLGIAWPSLRESFQLPQAALGWILSGHASGYFMSGLFAGRLLVTAGVGSLLAGSTALVTLGVAGYAISPGLVPFAAAAMVVGWGSGAVDAGLNTHAAVHFRPGQMAWLHAAYSTGAALGSFGMAWVVVEALGWRLGYAVIAALLGALTVAFLLTRGRWSMGEKGESAVDPYPAPRALGAFAALSRGRVRLGALVFFVYSGVEFGLGHWAYTILTEARGLSRGSAAAAVSAYWALLLFGRVGAGFVIERVGNERLVRAGTCLAAAGSLLFALPGVPVFCNVAGLVAVGAAIAPIYPGLMSETPRRMGGAAAHAVGFQVSAATAGMVALPALGGLLADRAGLSATATLILASAIGVLILHELLVRVTRESVSASSP
ncbi:MAG TPA: MFS transporter [Polyangiaceae bacterium]